MKKDIIQTLKILIAAAVLSLGISYVYAWTAPPQAPPAGNTPAPLDVGIKAQNKTGALSVGKLSIGNSSVPTNTLEVSGTSLFGSTANFLGSVTAGGTVTAPTVNTTVINTSSVTAGVVSAPTVNTTNLTASGVVSAPTVNTTNLNVASVSTNTIKFANGSVQTSAPVVKNPTMIGSGLNCIGRIWYPPAGYYNFIGADGNPMFIQLKVSGTWITEDYAGFTGTMWVDGSNMRFKYIGGNSSNCIYWQKFDQA